jgi:hypothetical protein
MINHCLDVAHFLYSHMGTQVSFYACIQILYACTCILSRSKGMFWCAQHEHGLQMEIHLRGSRVFKHFF